MMKAKTKIKKTKQRLTWCIGPTMRERLLLAEVAAWPESMQGEFHRMLTDGMALPLAHMLACRQGPRVMTDDVMLSGAPTVSQMHHENPEMTAKICEAALAQGYRPKPTDVYLGSVANSMGDPQAFLNHGQGRGHLQKTLDERGYRCRKNGDSGSIATIECREPEVDPHENPVNKLHPKIVNRIRKNRIKENPDLARKDQRELRADIVSQHGQ